LNYIRLQATLLALALGEAVMMLRDLGHFIRQRGMARPAGPGGTVGLG
jgi:hypothetical protein